MARIVALLVGLGLAALCYGIAGADSAWQRVADPVFLRTDTRELPEAAVMSVAQDRAGFVWVGTQGGLARYDGYHYHDFIPNPGDPKALPDGYIRTIRPDDGDGLWIGSSSDGLVHYDAMSEQFHTWRPGGAAGAGPRSASVDAIADAGDGALWIGGDGGLDRFDTRGGTFAPFALAARGAQPVVWSVLVDRTGAVWAAAQTGLYVRPAGSDRFRAFALPGPARSVYALTEDRRGNLWAGSVNAVFELDGARHVARVLRSDPADRNSLAPGQQWSVAEMTPGVMWIGTDDALTIVDEGDGLVRRIAADTANPGGLTSGRVLQFLRDRSGLVWIADHVGGLLLYNPAGRGLHEISATRPDLGLVDQGAVAVDALPGGALWVGGFSGRLVDLNLRTARTQVFVMPNRSAVQVLATGADRTLWIGTTVGLCRLVPDAAQPVCSAPPSALSGASIYALLEDRGRLWIGGSTGLLVDDLRSGRVEPFPRAGTTEPFSNNQVRALYLDRERRLWVGTENGLNRIDPDGRIARFVFVAGVADSIGPGGVAAILEDRRGRIWVGANGGPLNVLQLDPSGTVHVRHLGVADGLPHDNVDGIAEDARGRIWVSTDKGIALIDPDTMRARGLGPADGVTDGAYWAGTESQADDGTMFFGGLDGVTAIAPDATASWTYQPPVVVTALHIGRRSVPLGDVNARQASIEIPADARDVTVEFAALDYSAPQALRYQYRLTGYDREWVDTDATHRIATYTHLAPGRYTLEIRGSNRIGTWSDRALALEIDALPAWYETWWFRLIVAALVVLAAYAVYRARTAAARRRQRELETLVGKRTAELSAANAQLQELSLSDPLTGLRNRRFLDQHLDSDIAMTQRRFDDWAAAPGGEPPYDADILFFLIDLDNFKTINDRFGHHAGDAVLMQMRERLQEVFRESDFVVRWGGDEFLTVARSTRRSDAPMLAERLREVVMGRPFALGSGQSIDATASVGFAAFPFVPAKPGAVGWYQVVGLADHALYMAKMAGRNTWYGLAAGAATDPQVLVAKLEGSAEDLIHAAALDVIDGARTPAAPP